MEMAAPGPLSEPASSQPGPRGLPPGILLDTCGSELAAPAIVIDGRQLRQWRRQHGLSQEKLAHLAGISVTTVARLERQPRASCRGYTLGRLAAALGAHTVGMTGPEPDHRAAGPSPSTPAPGPAGKDMIPQARARGRHK
jgi:DNA-binding XRE family transcriptional regulator